MEDAIHDFADTMGRAIAAERSRSTASMHAMEERLAALTEELRELRAMFTALRGGAADAASEAAMTVNLALSS